MAKKLPSPGLAGCDGTRTGAAAWPELLLTALLACAVLAAFLGIGGFVAGRDVAAMHVPYYAFLGQAEGLGILWNPYSHCGAPGLANIALAQLYPPNLLAPVLPPLAMAFLFTALHIAAFACGVRVWLGLRLGPAAARLGTALACGSFAFRALLEYGHLTILASAACIVWGLALLDLALDAARASWRAALRPGAGFGLVVALLLLGGHPQYAHAAFLAWGVLFLARVVVAPRVPLLPAAVALGVPAVLGALAAWPQLHATLQALPFTGRAHFAGEGFGVGGGSAACLPKAFAPWIFGGPGSYWGQDDAWFAHAWAGAAFLPLVGSAVALAWREARWRVHLALSALFLLVSLGGPFHAAFRLCVPGAGLFRLPGRYLLVAFLLALPAALAALEARRGSATLRRAVLAAVVAALALAALQVLSPEALRAVWAGVLPGRVAARMAATAHPQAALLLGLMAGEVLLGAAVLLLWRPGDGRRTAFAAPALAWLGMGVVSAAVPLSKVPVGELRPAYVAAAGSPRVLMRDEQSFHNAPLLFGLHSPGGYDSLSLLAYRRFLDTLTPQDWTKQTREQLGDPDDPRWSWLDVGWVAADPAALLHGPDAWQPRPAKGRYFLAETWDWPGRPESPDLAGIDAAQRALRQRLAGAGWDIRPASDAGRVTLESYSCERVILRVRCERDALLASSENHYPGWRAWVDGGEVPVERWLGTFRAVALTAGAHEVVFAFDRGPFRRDLAVALTALALLALLALVPRRGPVPCTPPSAPDRAGDGPGAPPRS